MCKQLNLGRGVRHFNLGGKPVDIIFGRMEVGFELGGGGNLFQLEGRAEALILNLVGRGF